MTDRKVLVLASRNNGKLREIQKLLADLPIQVKLLQDVGVSESFDVDETGSTFIENATLKATLFSQQCGHPTLADDSGLSVLALQGAPGVFSKRYGPGTDHDRNQKLLAALDGQTDRRASFHCALCLVDPALPAPVIFEGEVSGVIADAERGDAGFGYDPLFIPDGYTQTFAELGAEVKNKIGHRARALEKFKEFARLRYFD